MGIPQGLPLLACVLWGRCYQPGRDLVKQVLSETGNVVKKLVQVGMSEIQNRQFGFGHHRGVARVTRNDGQFPHDIASSDCRDALSIACH